jgi:hypothetical protein
MPGIEMRVANTDAAVLYRVLRETEPTENVNIKRCLP